MDCHHYKRGYCEENICEGCPDLPKPADPDTLREVALHKPEPGGGK